MELFFTLFAHSKLSYVSNILFFSLCIDTGSWPPANPNWFKQQDLMSSLGPFMGQMGGMGGGAAPAQAAA